MLFESTKCRELSDVDRNAVPSFQCRITKVFLDVFKVVSWDLKVPGSCYAVGELGPLMVFIPEAFGTLPVDYFVCYKTEQKLRKMTSSTNLS